MRKVDIYDFDKTVLPYDSALKYWGFCMLYRPWILVLLPLQFCWGMMMLCHIISVKTCKKVSFWYINIINNERTVKKFWDRHEKDIYDWFRAENRQGETVVISASPDFLIEEICSRLGVDHVIATKYTKRGTMIGENCRKSEKTRRFFEEIMDVEVENVYSDNTDHDRAIFDLGKQKYRASKGILEQFEYDNDQVVLIKLDKEI